MRNYDAARDELMVYDVFSYLLGEAEEMNHIDDWAYMKRGDFVVLMNEFGMSKADAEAAADAFSDQSWQDGIRDLFRDWPRLLAELTPAARHVLRSHVDVIGGLADAELAT